MATAANQQQQLTALGQGFIVHNADTCRQAIYTNPVNQQSTTQIRNQETNKMQHIGESVTTTTNNNLLLLLLLLVA